MDYLVVAWSEQMTPEEQHYKDNGFTKTKMSIFTQHEPSQEELINSFNVKKENLSLGAIALCSHSSRHDWYPRITGNNDNKNKIADQFIRNFLKSPITWKNIHSVNKHIGELWIAMVHSRRKCCVQGMS